MAARGGLFEGHVVAANRLQAPQGRPRAPKMTPRLSQRGPQSSPGTSQNDSKAAPKCSPELRQCSPGCCKLSPNSPQAFQLVCGGGGRKVLPKRPPSFRSLCCRHSASFLLRITYGHDISRNIIMKKYVSILPFLKKAPWHVFT